MLIGLKWGRLMDRSGVWTWFWKDVGEGGIRQNSGQKKIEEIVASQ